MDAPLLTALVENARLAPATQAAANAGLEARDMRAAGMAIILNPREKVFFTANILRGKCEKEDLRSFKIYYCE